MSELEAKIKCKKCGEVFVLYEDLALHGTIHLSSLFKPWLAATEAKANSFESVVKEDLTKE